MKIPIVQNDILNPAEVDYILNSVNYNEDAKNLVRLALNKIDKASESLNIPKHRFYPIINLSNNEVGIWLD